MHLLLTDRMACPRCGPAFGLILRADRMEDRRVLEGGLGCPNCREVYPIRGGVGDLRPPPREHRGPAGDRDTPPAPAEDRVEMAHALLGLAEGPGEVAFVGDAARFAAAVAARISGVEAVALHPDAWRWEPGQHVSRVVIGARLPFNDRTFRGVLLEGPGAEIHLREAARVLAPGHRVVVLDSPEGTPATLMASGLILRLEQDGVVVADR